MNQIAKRRVPTRRRDRFSGGNHAAHRAYRMGKPLGIADDQIHRICAAEHHGIHV
jgi:hypothetical protein